MAKARYKQKTKKAVRTKALRCKIQKSPLCDAVFAELIATRAILQLEVFGLHKELKI